MNFRFIRVIAYLAFFLIRTTPKRAQLYRLYEVDPAEASRIANDYVSTAIRKVIKIAGVEVDVKGLENIPDGACLFVGNHQSYFDVMIDAFIPGGVGFVAKDSLQKIPMLRSWMELIHCLLLDRSDLKEGIKVLLKGATYLKEGYSMFIFPEGTRGNGKELLEFKGGSLKIAQKSKCPIVPVAISGTRDLFENNKGFRVKPGLVTITFAEPVYISALPKAEQKLVSDQIKETIESLLVKPQN